MFMFRFGHHHTQPPPFGGSLLFNGILFICFGLAVLAAPELLAYFIATLLIIFGASLLTAWWKIQQWKKMK